MNAQDIAVLRSLVSVAWADGRVSSEETDVIEALLQAFGATPQECADLRVFAAEKRTLADVPVTELSSEDRRMLIQHAVLLSHIDGEQSPEEVRLIAQLCDRLRIPKEEAASLIAAAEGRAQRFLHLG